MASSREWPILEEIAFEGRWSQTIWEYAREMKRGDRDALLGPAGTNTLPDGRVYEVGPSYATGLGCDSERQVLRRKRAAAPSFAKVPVPGPR